ncbi:type II toxin-antitoxin system RelE/ParE family toxin [Methanocalculus sp.]|uniref:type II toxin-antitoxin system RelE family toxin n=1 Tax=Methanocalculus sp. TaxID=2004547 RepID=UPI00263881C7|nr:type II toxin-antitoxin system RelE/ParE family toxin [Methanocalculus sp.]MDG6249474.1 type II toxin-antitoxin system RelE/ParE family toxin [Methanocalculus sp.]
MTFEIHYSKAADRDLSKLPNEVIKKIVYAIGDIREDPFAHIQKMKGAKNPPQYKFRVGEYRVILLLDQSEKVLLVDGIGHRSTIYQRYGK